jgi:hypothetical protein
MAVLRLGKGPHQVDVKVTETLDWIGDGLGCRRWLFSHLSTLALLTVSTPGRNLGHQARPDETAGNQLPGRPDAWVGQTVNGVEDEPPETGGDQGAKNA